MRFAILILLAFAFGFVLVLEARIQHVHVPQTHIASVWDGCLGRHHEIVPVFGKECR